MGRVITVDFSRTSSSWLERLWKNQPGDYFFLSTKSQSGKWTDHCIKREELGTFKHLDLVNGENAYFCPHGFSKPKRKREYAVPPKLLYADLDEVNPADPTKCPFRPTIALQTSNGRYVGIWETDGPVTEDLNKRMSCLVGADPSGWDFTQVLRCPFTRNYKYPDQPEVMIAWDNEMGFRYQVDRLEQQIPPMEQYGFREGLKSEPWPAEVYVNKAIERELALLSNEDGKQEETINRVFFNLARMVKSGRLDHVVEMAIKAAMQLTNHRKGDPWTREALERKWNHAFKDAEPRWHDPGDEVFNLRRLDQIQERETEWLWYPYLARQEVTIVEGDPGIGKSYAMQQACILLCDGKPLPFHEGKQLARGGLTVMYFSVEDDASRVIKKRMRGINHPERFWDSDRACNLNDKNIERVLWKKCEELDPDVLFFDTTAHYIGKGDTHVGTEVTQALEVFTKLARRFDCSVVLVRHMTKGGREKALYRGQGNISFAGTARIVLQCGRIMDVDEEGNARETTKRYIAGVKANLAPKPPSLTFEITSDPTNPRVPRFTWGDFIEEDADELLKTPQGGLPIDRAMKWLKTQLEEGPETWDKLVVMAHTRGISTRTLRRAAGKLGVVRTPSNRKNGGSDTLSLKV